MKAILALGVVICLLCGVVAFRAAPRLKVLAQSMKSRQQHVGSRLGRLCASDTEGDGAEEVGDGAEVVDEGEVVSESEDFAEVLDSVVAEGGGVNATEEAEAEPEPEPTPLEKAIKEREEELTKQLADLEGKLRTERVNTMKVKDKLSESGKTGFFMVQAQVAEFLKKKDADQKTSVIKNKREFVSKILPVVDAFNAAPLEHPAETEREENMHKSFGSLVSSIMIVFEKYGVKEYSPDAGDKLDSYLHQVERVVEGDTDGVIQELLRPGYKDSEGEVIRRALVVAAKIEKADEEKPAEDEKGEEADGEEEEQGGEDGDEEEAPQEE